MVENKKSVFARRIARMPKKFGKFVVIRFRNFLIVQKQKKQTSEESNE